MKKRLITFLLVTILAFAFIIPAQAKTGSLSNFKVRNTYVCGQYCDVDGSDWYAASVQACFEYGLLGGSSGSFLPGGDLTAAEAIKLADILSSIYLTGWAAGYPGAPYKVYIDDALRRGIIDAKPEDYDVTVTRAQFAEMIGKALPAAAFSAKGQVTDNAIPDVSVSDSFGAAVYMLYRAGVLTGSDRLGTFRPYETLSRAEAAAIAARAADASFRKSVTLPAELTGSEVYERCAPAVFYLERYDSEGVLIGIGSGFFISRDGLAVTNYHVIAGASSATIWMLDGTEYEVKGICGYDKTKDIAVLQIDGDDFQYLDIADSDTVEVGARVFAIGSPFGLTGTISDGIVSNVLQEVNDSEFIQFSAPISMGSGGGPVLNTMGQVVCITCLTTTSGQTLNFAVPINDLIGLSRTDGVPLIAIVAKNSESTVYYRSYFPVPDYGVFVGTPIYESSLDEATNVKTYFYRLSDITVTDEVAIAGYEALLKQNGFEWQRSYKSGSGDNVDVYYNANYFMSVHFGIDDISGEACRFVAIY